MHAGLLNETNFNSTHVQEHTVPYFPFPIWRDESMHELLMQMARSVTEVIKAARDPGQPPGNLLRSLIRVDVAVVQQQGLVSHPCSEMPRVWHAHSLQCTNGLQKFPAKTRCHGSQCLPGRLVVSAKMRIVYNLGVRQQNVLSHPPRATHNTCIVVVSMYQAP